MSDDRPLDELIPGLRPGGPRRTVHLMEAAIDARPAWVIALDEELAGAAALRKRVQEIIEGAIVGQVSAPAPHVLGLEARGYGAAPMGGVHLLSFRAIGGDVARAVHPFGLAKSSLTGARWDEIRATLLQSTGLADPVASFSAVVSCDPRVLAAHDALIADTLEPWGASPGQPAERLLHLAEDLGARGIEPDLAGLDAMERLFVSAERGVIRWIPPLILQALADFIGLVAQGLGSTVEWAECAPEPDGYTPPPLFRLGAVHVPIALHLVQWCVMPILAGEHVPPLSAWLRDQLGPAS